jgi:hypothetical protein
LFVLWVARGRPIPPPEIAKYRTVREWQKRFRCPTFVETGTYLGDMINAVRDDFAFAISIELDEMLATEARRRFAQIDNVRILQGDSGELLPVVLGKVQTRCLFWLDAHYAGGITARGADDTPIEIELDAIFEHPLKDHVVLIDDARLFDGTHGYPSLSEVQKRVRDAGSYEMDVVADIIRIYPKDNGRRSSEATGARTRSS